jgi:maleamate amidohydrolase
MATGQTKEIYQRAMLGQRLGFGKRPAVLIVDMQAGLTRPELCPLAANLDAQVTAINRLIEQARPKSVPIIFTATGFESSDRGGAGLWLEKIPSLRLLKMDTDLVEVDRRLDKQPNDIFIVKRCASCFHNTHLAATLTAIGIDTLIIAGFTTSGCIRSTTVDAISYGFRPIVPIEAVGDRAEEQHESNLFDIGSKYGDVLPLDEVLFFLRSL